MISKMTKKITLQKPVKTPDGMGGQGKPSWADVVTIWADFLPPSASTDAIQGTIVSEMLRKLSIWKRDDVRKGWRVKHTTKDITKYYDVEHAYPYDDLHTTLICKEVVK